MKFTAPRGFWQWLACFSPAIINLFAVSLGPRIEFAMFGYSNRADGHLAWAVWGMDSLMLGAVICFGLGGWVARKSSTFRSIAAGSVIYGLAFVVTNLAVAFSGCAMASALKLDR